MKAFARRWMDVSSSFSLFVLLAMLNSCGGGREHAVLSSYKVTPELSPTQDSLPGFDHGEARPIAVVSGPQGRRAEFVANEIIYLPKSQDDLNAFLVRYGGTVLRDSTPIKVTGMDRPSRTAEPFGWVLVRIDPKYSALDDLPANMDRAGASGEFRFSSEDGVRLAALIARERERGGLGPNLVLYPQAVREHDNGIGGYYDASEFWWMTEDDDLSTPGDQGLSIGVVHAWDYLRYMHRPPTNEPYYPVYLALIDGGFNLDETTGLPATEGGLDYFDPYSAPPQADLIDHDGLAGGENTMHCSGGSLCPWHGQGVFGVAAAMPRNLYGWAGTSGGLVRTMFLRTSGDLYTVADAIRAAAYHYADVISLSLSGGCGDWAWACAIPPDDIYKIMRKSVELANGWGSMVIAAAGNDGRDIDDEDVIPCKTEGVMCVGGVDRFGMNQYNYGHSVAIWAPTNVLSTLTPVTAAQDPDNVGLDELYAFGGTSAATPFVAGIAAMMKVASPYLIYEYVWEKLQLTANPSTDPLVRYGYVDAFRAVASVLHNQPPAVSFTHPANGAEVPWGGVSLKADVIDPELSATELELPGWHTTVVFSSDIDGTLCSEELPPFVCTSPALSLGTHTITATATDAFGAVGAATLTINAINRPPVPTINNPKSTGIYYAHIPVKLAAYIYDPDDSIPDTGVRWSSSRDGDLGFGWTKNVNLTVGVHLLTVVATDAHGLTGQAQVTIIVLPSDGLPKPEIFQPDDGSIYAPGTAITFIGRAIDPEDGYLTGASLRWTSDYDGLLGTGTTVTTTLSGPSTPCNPEYRVHTITLEATDSDGYKTSVSIIVHVGTMC